MVISRFLPHEIFKKLTGMHYFWSIFNRVMVLDWHHNFVYAQYLVNQFVDFDQICIFIDIDKM